MKKMKDSGIEWIGFVPENWCIKRLKFLGMLASSGVDKKIVDGEPLFKSVHYMNVYNNSLNEIGNSDDYLIISANENKARSCALECGDVLFTNSSETPEDMGHSTVVFENLVDTLFGYHLMRFRPSENFELHYLKYMFGSHYMRKWFEYRSTGMTRFGISYIDFAQARIIFPPILEQTAIAAFLDDKCAKVDSITDKTLSQIEKLKAYKQSVIAEAVTKGFDPAAKMKDSGVEWIGEIPEGWKKVSLKYLARIRYGLSQPPSEIENGTPLIRATNIERGIIVENNLMLVNKDEIPDGKDAILSCRDILVVRSGAYAGDSAYVTSKYIGAIAGYDMVVRVNDINSVRFLSYTFLSPYVLNNQLLLQRERAAQPHLNAAELGNVFIIVPPFHEQTAIAAHLDDKCAQIDSAIAKKLLLLEKLEAYKKSLIFEAVTGKMEVPNEIQSNI